MCKSPFEQNSGYLGTERLGALLGKFAIPCIFSLIISCLYNIVGQIFVGNGVGCLGNAAIDISLQPAHTSGCLARRTTDFAVLFCICASTCR